MVKKYYISVIDYRLSGVHLSSNPLVTISSNELGICEVQPKAEFGWSPKGATANPLVMRSSKVRDIYNSRKDSPSFVSNINLNSLD